ncbi:MAG: metallophosphoesterase [Thermoplasmatales archaeon]|nr:MAG: metallophosphoesterase [Thermoplasmatales archaeon]
MTDVENIINRVVNDPDYVACLDENEIEDCLEEIKPILEKEESLIELNGNVVFIGDTHGDFNTTKAIVERFFNVNHLVFLGDYIDREPMKWGSIYNITYLLLLKCSYPEKIVLLKGNHECNYAIPCFPYEFEVEIIQRYGSSDLHGKYVGVFSSMPLMVLTNNVFAAHGGILKEANLKQLRTTGKNDLGAIESLVWSDPVVSLTYRGAGNSFNEEDLVKFLDGINARVFIRGHDYDNLGISIYGDRCITIFSSSRYKEMGNRGILVAIADKEVSSASDLVIKDFSIGKWIIYEAARR